MILNYLTIKTIRLINLFRLAW